jgi:uncharacterized protein (TIGR03083 family)
MERDEVWQAIDTQRLRLTEMLDGLTDDEWRHPSLCDGWTVRDVAAHLTYAQSTLPQILGDLVRHPAGMKRGIREGAIRRASRPTAQLVGEIRGMVGSQRHITLVTYRETLIDILVHSQDIAVPLGRPFDLDPRAAAFAARRVWTSGYPFWPRRRFKGVALIATDTDWTAGEGREEKAPIGTILLRLTGRNIPTG